ncbi:MAG: SH3 domain-containing protein [Clostridia bacterium]|nr:SH3 domain-containing protein [Clostridia bacterium]
MANEHEYDKNLGQTKRISPFQQDDLYEADDYAADHEIAGQQKAYDDVVYDDVYDDAYAQNEYDEEYDEEYDGEEEAQGGFFSTMLGKVFAGVIALLVVVLVALLVVRFTSAPKSQQLPAEQPAQQPVAAEATKAPGTIVFAPAIQETPEPTAEPTPVPTNTPTAEPKPTATPLPIIMTNTPTPSPTPTVTPTPTPSPTPAPTATPEPTAVPEIGYGEVNRDAKLRAQASSSGKVKSTIKKGERVTIHETILDQDSKVWYALTVDDLETAGWMRDYVVDLDKKIAKPTHTPNLTATPEPEAEKAEEAEKIETTPEPTKAPAEDAIGTGRTEKEANLRKVMNGKVIVQLRKNKKVEILSAKVDKNGKLWYEVRPEDSTTVGFVRDYLIKLDEGVKIAAPTATPKAEATAKPEAEEKEEAPAEKKEDILDREIIGKAKTKKPANIRVKPASGAKLVRQLSKGVELMVLEKYQDAEGNIWYEVCTESGRTQGFVRDYLLNFSEIDKNREALTYGKE